MIHIYKYKIVPLSASIYVCIYKYIYIYVYSYISWGEGRVYIYILLESTYIQVSKYILLLLTIYPFYLKFFNLNYDNKKSKKK